MPQNLPKPTFKQTRARKDNTRAVIPPDKVSGVRARLGDMERMVGAPMNFEPTETERLIEATIRQRAVWNAAIEKSRAEVQAQGTAYYRPPASAARWQSAFPTWWR